MSFTELFSTFANNLLPILLIASAGYIVGKTLTVDSRTIGRIVFYIFSPLLVFNLLVTSNLNLKQAASTFGFTAIFIISMGIIAFIVGKIFKLERSHLLAVILTVGFGNTGNYGLPVVKFAFGDDALAVASIFFVATSILFNTGGVIIASLGQSDLKSAILGLFKIPSLYGVALALVVKFTDFQMPIPLERTIEIAANGAVPSMIVLLGLELTRIEWTYNFKALSIGVLIKLLIAPMIGLIIASMFGFQGFEKQANVMQAAMPAAVATTVVANEFRLESSLVTAIVFLGTILSPLTLTPLIVFLSR
ncbi:MAG: AEC family transporter [Anaerolineales bacterium]|nr:AEC family transporter [Anaerolineales bacterium]